MVQEEKDYIHKDYKPCYRDYLKSDKDVFIKLFGQIRIETLKGVITSARLQNAKYDLIKLFVVSNHPLNPKEIIEQIEPNKVPRGEGGIRQLISSTRKITRNILPGGINLIETMPNGYQLASDLNIITDFSWFIKYCKKANNESALIKKARYLQKAVDLYRGDILVSDDSGDKIGVALTTTYNRICHNIVEELCDINNQLANYNDVHRVAAEALSRGFNDSDIHYWIIMSQYALGRTDSAEKYKKNARKNLDEESFILLEKRINDELKK